MRWVVGERLVGDGHSVRCRHGGRGATRTRPGACVCVRARPHPRSGSFPRRRLARVVAVALRGGTVPEGSGRRAARKDAVSTLRHPFSPARRLCARSKRGARRRAQRHRRGGGCDAVLYDDFIVDIIVRDDGANAGRRHAKVLVGGCSWASSARAESAVRWTPMWVQLSSRGRNPVKWPSAAAAAAAGRGRSGVHCL